jgi:hypothetical protein
MVKNYERSEVLKTVVHEEFVFWDIMTCSLLKVKPTIINNVASISGLNNRPSKKVARSRQQAKRRLTFNGLHGVIFQMMEVFIN